MRIKHTKSINYSLSAIHFRPALVATILLFVGLGLSAKELTAGYEAWSGEAVLVSDWTKSYKIPAGNFADANVGDILHVEYRDWNYNPRLSLCSVKWKALDGFGAYLADHCCDDFALSEAALSEIQANGMLIAGCGLTVTSIRIYNPSEVVALSPSVAVTDSWTYTEITPPNIRINACNTTDCKLTAEAEVVVLTDQYETVGTYAKEMEIGAGATATVDVDFKLAPGIYRCVALVNRQLARTFCIAVEPELIISMPDMQSDFEAFWTEAKAELAAVDPEYTLTELTDKSTAARKVYFVEMKSVNNNAGEAGIVRAYYAEPTGEGCYPVVVNYPGYDGGTGTSYCPTGDHIKDFAELYVSIRGQQINNRAPYENSYGEWRTYGLGSEDTYYYRQAYLDAVRAIDFLASRSAIDRSNIFVTGASQGAALSLTTAALDGRIKAAAIACTAMGDFPDYFKIQSWPGSIYRTAAAEIGLAEDDMMEILSYFDTKNFAPMVTCPVKFNFSLQDATCPPHTNLASYNNLPSSVEKSYTVNAELAHATPSGWSDEVMSYFREHLDDTTGVDNVSTDAHEAYAQRYDLQGRPVDKAHKGIVVERGRLIFVR
jgi:cephalosporin-C deacetylase-like acetyl esterase